MYSEPFEIILPSLAFFFLFFAAAILLELGVVFTLNLIFYQYWKTVATIACSRKKKWHRRIELAFCLFIALSILALIAFSHIIELLITSDPEIKIYALELFLATILIYRITTHFLPSDACGNCKRLLTKAHKYLYFLSSSLIAILTLSLINQHYQGFKNLIHSTLSYSVTGQPPLIINNRTKSDLIDTFRLQIHQGLCPRIDYSTCNTTTPAFNMVYVATETDLRIDTRPINRSNPKDYLTGRACTNGETTFLLTDHGQWYWLIDEDKIIKP